MGRRARARRLEGYATVLFFMGFRGGPFKQTTNGDTAIVCPTWIQVGRIFAFNQGPVLTVID